LIDEQHKIPISRTIPRGILFSLLLPNDFLSFRSYLFLRDGIIYNFGPGLVLSIGFGLVGYSLAMLDFLSPIL
jgi:hypothetical protein